MVVSGFGHAGSGGSDVGRESDGHCGIGFVVSVMVVVMVRVVMVVIVGVVVVEEVSMVIVVVEMVLVVVVVLLSEIVDFRKTQRTDRLTDAALYRYARSHLEFNETRLSKKVPMKSVFDLKK